MIIKTVNLETVCGITSTLPVHDKPEFAFAGKSNVGKSSLINAVMNRKSYARTSAEPGKTQTINYYNVNDAFYLVDLPGYGYARVSQSEKEKWGKMIERYLHRSESLRQVFLLVDIRHEPGANDRQMLEWILANGYTPVVLATKLDKLNQAERRKAVPMLRRELELPPEVRILPFSSVTKEGREELYTLLDELLTGDDEEKTE